MMLKQNELYLFAIFILILPLYDIQSISFRKTARIHIYQNIIKSLIFIQLLEILTWMFDGRSGLLNHTMNYILNSSLFAASLLPLSLWLSYLDEFIIHDKAQKNRRKIVYRFANLIIMLLAIINPFWGILFTLTPDNMYTRQVGVYIILFLNYGLYLGYAVSLRTHWKFISGRIYKLILGLGILPVLGAALQMYQYGLTLIWPMMTLVTLSAYILIEKDEEKRDLLTGLYSRIHLENRSNYKIKNQQAFSLLMIDLDQFKFINDAYGHSKGDEALQKTAQLLLRNIKMVDSAYRIGGDEFVVLIESEKPETGKIVLERLEESLKKINLVCPKPYKLSLSAGAAFYDGSLDKSLKDLLNEADRDMYLNKKSKILDSSDHKA